MEAKDAFEVLTNALLDNPDVGLVYADQYITNDANENYENAKKIKLEKMPDFDYVIQLDRCIVYSHRV